MSNTPAPIFNHRKRPRQSLLTDPQQNIGSFSNPGPSGAASYNDLMPPGGFGNNSKPTPQGRSYTPSNGQGAAYQPQQNNNYGNTKYQGKQPVGSTSRYPAPNTNNRQAFSSNNNARPQPTQNRQQNQSFNSQSKQQTIGQCWNQKPGYQQQSNQSNSTPQTGRYQQSNTQATGAGGQSSWSRNTGNPVNNNNNNNRTGYGNNNQNNIQGYGQNNNSNTGNRGNYNNTSFQNNNSGMMTSFGNNNTNNNYNNMNHNNSNTYNNTNANTGYGSNQSSWNRNGGNPGNTTQRFTGQNTSQNIAGGNRGGLQGIGNNRSGPQYGTNTKMVATNSSSYHMDNRQAGNRNFNNNTLSNQGGGSSQYRFKGSNNQGVGGVQAVGNDMDEWDSSFDESTQGMSVSVSNTQKQVQKKQIPIKSKQTPQDSGIRVLTVNVNGIKRWSKFKDSFTLLFEMFGVLDSAVTKSSTDCKEFMLCDEERNSVKCVFFEIDRQIPKMTRGMPYRIVGSYDRSNDRIKCSSVRSTSDRERTLGAKLASVCTQAMIGDTRTLREI